MQSARSFSSIYRLQLSEELSFSAVQEHLSYFLDLGIDGVYFSPYFKAFSHGYDVLDPNQLNEKLGSIEEYRQLCAALKENNIAHIIDVIPNHMGIRGGNFWWEDVLAKGRASTFASFFAIDWNPEKKELKDKILLPILNKSYSETLAQKEIVLQKEGARFCLKYGNDKLPLAVETYPLENEIEAINAKPDLMHELLEKQHYRVAFYKVASHEINYRRFFNINDIIALHIEKKEVLETHHKWVFELMTSGVVDALRIDHPDGLYDPSGYFREVKRRANLPLIVEKILAYGEDLPKSWQVEGSVGYDYLNLLNGLFVCQKNEEKMSVIYEEFIQEKVNFNDLLYRSKRIFSDYTMVNEITRMASLIEKASKDDLTSREFAFTDVKEALEIIVSSFPVYRTYIEPDQSPSESDEKYIKIAFAQARKRTTHLDASLFDFLEKLFLCTLPVNEEEKQVYKECLLSFQQISGAIMAKGLEDTTFYIYNRLLSLNEVGSDPSYFGFSKAEFDTFNQKKQKFWPLGFLPSSTHDTKRSEDVRMRINVLSELPEEWRELIIASEPSATIDRNTLYFIYQTLLGIWPSQIEHLWPLIQKSLREAETHTNWEQPNCAYEKEVYAFLLKIMTPSSHNHFLPLFIAFQKKVNQIAILSSLSATVIRAASCGVFDLYQGNEELHYTLVDPDNRKKVDFASLKRQLAQVKEKSGEELFANEEYNLLKTWLIYKLLSYRKKDPSFFLFAEYIPLEVKGKYAENVIAFMRSMNGKLVVMAAARFYSELGKGVGMCWKETKIHFSEKCKEKSFINLFTGKRIEVKDFCISLETLFSEMPFALLALKII